MPDERGDPIQGSRGTGSSGPQAASPLPQERGEDAQRRRGAFLFLRHFFIALQFFTRIPVTGRLADWVGFSPALLRASAAHFPGVGWVVGEVGHPVVERRPRDGVPGLQLPAAEVHFIQAGIDGRGRQIGAQATQFARQLLRTAQARHPHRHTPRQQRNSGGGRLPGQVRVGRYVAGAVTQPRLQRDPGVAQQPELQPRLTMPAPGRGRTAARWPAAWRPGHRR